MLALVHPQQDGYTHRQTARPQRPPARKPPSAASSSSSRAVAPPPPPVSAPRTRRTLDPPVIVRVESDPDPEPAPPPPPPPFDVHSYSSTELLRLLASLLAQIAATNDKLDAVTPAAPPSTTPTRTTLATVTPTDAPIWRTLTTASRTAVSTPSSVLTFHARNVPTISLEAYLLRILKYCPTTNEVFLSLLVYFDRMSKLSAEATGRTFVIDSYNIHRLVIAGVTVASKFFSDVFYTNSRYAKVGGLPQAELNQLELQFLLLNDFRLVIPRDEMQRYAEQLILFSNSPETAATVPPPVSTPVAAPMQAMGAIDAYGGRLPSMPNDGPAFPSPSSSSSSSTPSASASAAQASSSNKTPRRYPGTASEHDGNGERRYPTDDDAESTETETETEGTETDGGWTTDDEPTIRPAHSSAGSSSDDTRSLSSADDTGDEGDDEGDADDTERSGEFFEMRGGDRSGESFEMEGVEEGERTPERVPAAMGDRTPERRGVPLGGDRRMASP
ncbi:cyclin-domain-containing protein [Mycena crocata]|nr:cyclin-domain-containing protein [Mycena crocata]